MRELRHPSDQDPGRSVDATTSVEVLGKPTCTSRGSGSAEPAGGDHQHTRSSEGVKEELLGIGAHLEEEATCIHISGESCLVLDGAGREEQTAGKDDR